MQKKMIVGSSRWVLSRMSRRKLRRLADLLGVAALSDNGQQKLQFIDAALELFHSSRREFLEDLSRDKPSSDPSPCGELDFVDWLKNLLAQQHKEAHNAN